MSSRFQIKQGDTSPGIKYELFPSTITLTGATVKFQMENAEGSTVLDAAATIDQITDPPIVSYAWQSGDTSLDGIYKAEFKVTYSDGTIETFPNNSFITVKVYRDIADI